MSGSSLASGFTTGFGSAFLQFVFERFASLGSFAWREISIIWDVEEELRKLHRTFFRVQDLVDHVNSSPIMFYSGSNAWALWFGDMRRLAYDADALLDHVWLHLSHYCAQHSISSDQQRQVRSMVMSSLDNFKLPHAIKEMQCKLDDLAEEIERLVMIEKTNRYYHYDSSRYPQSTSPFGVGRTLVGRRTDTELILGFLNEEYECPTGNFSVVSIMGMSGIGKTAIASYVYNDSMVSSTDFHVRIWVSVSVDSDAARITKSMIEYETLSACGLSDLGSLQRMLRTLLGGKRFLVVLDDYWSEKCDDWSVISRPFASGARGSKVIVTTRSKKVASVVCSSEAHTLEILSEDDCWEVIKESAVVSAESAQRMEYIGRQIAQRCKGVPLVATTLGHMLRSMSTEMEWCSVLEYELWDMSQDNNIFPRLIHNYLHLAPHLQKCFAYCAVFPQDYEFEMEELILLWVAEGFIQPKGVRTLEDLGRDYFSDLCLMFFFQKCKNVVSGQMRYKMHDLIHGLAQLVSKDICFHWKHDASNCYPLFGNSCHLSLLHDNTQPLELKGTVKNERLRTFLLISNAATTHLDPQLFSHLKFLRVLGLGGIGLAVLVDSIDQLAYLRYLNLSENPIYCLPKSMCKLAALQVLKLRGCPNLLVLPEEMSNLISLRHLDLEKGMFTRMPPNFGKLTNLQHLSVYVVSRKIECGVAELKSLNSLRGSLCITGIDASNANEAKEAKLDLKQSLERLEIEWTFSGRQSQTEQAQVLANLQPHTNLKELVIQNYCGKDYPPWLSDPSYHFTSIHLQGLKYCESLPSLGELPFLASFAISDMPCLELVDSAFYGTKKFPSLKSFELKDLSNLKFWEYDTDASDIAMPLLNIFTLHDCPLLTSLPQSLRLLLPISNVSDCPNLQP